MQDLRQIPIQMNRYFFDFVIPAKAGIQTLFTLDSCLRRNDKHKWSSRFIRLMSI